MPSKSFTLADPSEGGGGEGGNCGKCCMYSGIITFVVILVAAGVYFYQNSYACSYPVLDETGLSNWTSGADHIAYACFPNYFLEGESNLVVAKCENGLWNPLPPSCNSLPLRIDCHVNNQSITGHITMWQESAEGPTHIHGLINYTLALQPQGHVMEHVILSKRTCHVSHVIPEDPDLLLDPNHVHTHHPPTTTTPAAPVESNSTDESSASPSDSGESSGEEQVNHDNDNGSTENGSGTSEPDHGKLLRIKFNSTALKAYKKTDVFMNIIFVDPKTTATLVSVHQENLTLVMTSSDHAHAINSSWIMDQETRALLGMDLGI